MDTLTLHLVIIIIGLLLLQRAGCTQPEPRKSDFSSMVTLESQRIFLEHCLDDCMKETFSQEFSSRPDDEITKEWLCKEECYKKRDQFIDGECAVLYLGNSITFCTSSSCSFAPVSLFPPRFESFNCYHYVLLLAYCAKADMDVGATLGDLEDSQGFVNRVLSVNSTSVSVTQTFDALVDRIPENFPVMKGQHAVVKLFKTHPYIKIISNSVARLHSKLNQHFIEITGSVSKPHSEVSHQPEFLKSFDYSDTNQPIELYSYSDDNNSTVEESYDADTFKGLVSLFDYDIFESLWNLVTPYPHFSVEDADMRVGENNLKTVPCFMSLYRNDSGISEWMLSKGTQTGKFGYTIHTNDGNPTLPPSMIYSREYLLELCSVIKEYNPNKMISIDVESYVYEFAPINFSPYFRLSKINPSMVEIVRINLVDDSG